MGFIFLGQGSWPLLSSWPWRDDGWPACRGHSKGICPSSVLYFQRARLAANGESVMNPFSVTRFPPERLSMTEPGRREIDHGSLGWKPSRMIGVLMINFLLVVWLGKTLRKAQCNTGYFVQFPFPAKVGGKRSWPRSQPSSQRRGAKAWKKRLLFGHKQILYLFYLYLHTAFILECFRCDAQRQRTSVTGQRS